MLISQKSKQIIDSCRFCWMCRHICPIGNATGQERNTSRARALSLSLVERGAEPLSEVAENVYECALCGACTKECVTGWDPVTFTKEVRREIISEGVAPTYIENLLDNIEKYGNVYGDVKTEEKLAKAIQDLPQKADTLLYLGKDAVYGCSETALNAITLLKKAKVDFTVLADEPDSGYALVFLAGDTDEAKKQTAATAKVLNDYKTVVVFDPSDAKMFLREYKEWNTVLTAKTMTFTAYLAELLAHGAIKVKKSANTYTLQDSALLARDLEETEPAREILAALGDTNEMLLNKKDTMLAGNLVMNEYIPDVMQSVAAQRWENAVSAGVSVLVTECAAEYTLLAKTKPDNIRLLSIGEAVSECL